MKKLFSLLLAVILILPMGACTTQTGGEEMSKLSISMGQSPEPSKYPLGRLIRRAMKLPDVQHNYTWKTKSCVAPDDLYEIFGSHIWSDGKNVYHTSGRVTHVLVDGRWERKTWNMGNVSLGYLRVDDGDNIWTDGTNVYYSGSHQAVNDAGTTVTIRDHYVLNGDTWDDVAWKGYTDFYGTDIWTDGTNIYYSSDKTQYVLEGDTWKGKAWNSPWTNDYGQPVDLDGDCIWSDGSNIYWSCWEKQAVLNGNTWEEVTWNIGKFYASDNIWSIGGKIYYRFSYVLNGNTWEEVTWVDPPNMSTNQSWSDGTNIYCTYDNVVGDDYSHFVLERTSDADTSATVTFTCSNLLYTDKVYRIKAWCYPKGMDYWTAPATWESDLFAGTDHNENVTFTGLIPNTEYEVYACIYGTEGATEHNAVLTFTTLASEEEAVLAQVLCNEVTGNSFTAWLFTSGLEAGTEYTAEFAVYRNDASGVIYKDVVFTGEEGLKSYSCEFTDLLPNTDYVVAVDLYPTDSGEIVAHCEREVTTTGEIPVPVRDLFPLGFASGLSGVPITEADADYNTWTQGWLVGDALRKAL